jgi:predicted ATP-binding protein involved in virulence
MFRSVAFSNFKALENFSVALRRTNVLVGPNNAGKSTVLDGFRALAAALRYARRYRPIPVTGPAGKRMLGYQIPASTIPISTANIHSHYAETQTQVVFTLDSGRRLTLFWSCTEGSAKAPEERGHGMRVMFDVTLEGCTPCPEASLGRRWKK